jgi:hypothetical protein
MTDVILDKWNKLSQSEQDEFTRQSYYLIERGYILDSTPEELAVQIFASGVQKENGSPDN